MFTLRKDWRENVWIFALRGGFPRWKFESFEEAQLCMPRCVLMTYQMLQATAIRV